MISRTLTLISASFLLGLVAVGVALAFEAAYAPGYSQSYTVYLLLIGLPWTALTIWGSHTLLLVGIALGISLNSVLIGLAVLHRSASAGVRLALALYSPFVITSICLLISRQLAEAMSAHVSRDTLGYAALLLAAGAGALIAGPLFRSGPKRIAAQIAIAVALVPLIGSFSLEFVCSIFDECL